MANGTTATLVTSAGTVYLRGQAAAFAEYMARIQGEIAGLPFGSLEFHWQPTRPFKVRLIRTDIVREDA